MKNKLDKDLNIIHIQFTKSINFWLILYFVIMLLYIIWCL